MESSARQRNGFMDEKEINLGWPRKYVSREEYLDLMKDKCDRCGKEKDILQFMFIDPEGESKYYCVDCRLDIIKGLK